MQKIDSRFEKLTIILSKTAKEKSSSKNALINLWPQYTIEQIRTNPLIYKQPITPPPNINTPELVAQLKRIDVDEVIINHLSLVSVSYRGFDNKVHLGQVVVHRDLVSSIRKIFDRILSETNFPVTSVVPLGSFERDLPNGHNNSAAFDWRFVSSSDEISDHAFGAAIDINPLLNPWEEEGSINSHNDSRIPKSSKQSCYDPQEIGTLHASSDVVKIFKEEGWKWGGDWKYSKDWMHFYRPEVPFKYYGKREVI